MVLFARPVWKYVAAALAALLRIQPLSAAESLPAAERYRVEVVVEPALSHGFQGMKVGPDGYLYAGDVLGLTLWRIDRAKGKIDAFVPPPEGMADDLAFGPSGLLVWTHIVAGTVYGRTPGGRIYKIAGGLPGINAIGFTRGGRLFATQLGSADKLFELDPAGIVPPRLVLADIGGLNGFQIDDHDILWGPEGTRHRIIKLDLKTLKRTVVADGFDWPSGVALDSHGDLYVVDLKTGALDRVDVGTGVKVTIHQFAPGLDNITITADDQIYVSSPGSNSIFEVDPRSGDVTTVHAGKLTAPGGIAVFRHGGRDQLVVADVFDWKQVDPSAGTVHSFGRAIGKPYVQATNVSVGNNHALLTQWNNNTLVIADLNSGIPQRTVTGLISPEDAVERSDGVILVAQRDRGNIVAVDPAGKLTVFASGFAEPLGLALRPGELLVTDHSAGKLWQFDPFTGARRLLAQGLRQPQGVAFDRRGCAIVVESGLARVIRVCPGSTTTLAEHLPLGIKQPIGETKSWIPNGVAVAENGDIYLTTDQDSSVIRLVRH